MRVLAILLASVAITLPVPAAAQSADDKARIAALEAQVKALAEQVAALQNSRALTAPPAASPAPQPKPSASIARQPDETLPPLASNEVRSEDGRVRVVPTVLDRSLQDIGTFAEVSATSDSSQVSIKFGGMLSDPNLGGRPEGWARYDTWSLTGSAPLSKTGHTDLGTLDGFVNSSKLKLRWSQFRVKIARPEGAERGREIITQARAACRQASGPSCDNGIVGDEFVREWLGPSTQADYLRLAFPASLNWAYGLEGSVGYSKYSFLDTAGGVKAEEEKVPWSAKAFLSVLPGTIPSSWTAGLEYQRSWKENDPLALCPAAVTAPFTCLVGPGGAPARKSKLLGSLEYRRQFRLSDEGFLRSLGLSTMVTYDFENDDYGVDAPIYLVANDKGQMIGGIRFGYTSTSDGDDFVAGIFVGTAFSLFQ